MKCPVCGKENGNSVDVPVRCNECFRQLMEETDQYLSEELGVPTEIKMNQSRRRRIVV